MLIRKSTQEINDLNVAPNLGLITHHYIELDCIYYVL